MSLPLTWNLTAELSPLTALSTMKGNQDSSTIGFRKVLNPVFKAKIRLNPYIFSWDIMIFSEEHV